MQAKSCLCQLSLELHYSEKICVHDGIYVKAFIGSVKWHHAHLSTAWLCEQYACKLMYIENVNKRLLT